MVRQQLSFSCDYLLSSVKSRRVTTMMLDLFTAFLNMIKLQTAMVRTATKHTKQMPANTESIILSLFYVSAVSGSTSGFSGNMFNLSLSNPWLESAKEVLNILNRFCTSQPIFRCDSDFYSTIISDILIIVFIEFNEAYAD